MKKKEDRLDRVAGRLTPKAAVLAWMESTFQRFAEADEWVNWLAENPDDRAFRSTVPAIAAAAAEEAEASGGDPIKARGDAALEAMFLFSLVLGSNRGVLEQLVNEGLLVAYCARDLQLLLYRDAVSQDLNDAFTYIDDIAFEKEQAGQDATKEQAILERLSTYMIDQFETEGGMEFVNNRTMNRVFATERGPILPAPPSQLQEIRSKLASHLVGVYMNRQAIDVISRNYFDGRPVLFPRGRARLDAAVEMAEALVEEFNGFVKARLARFNDDQLLHTEKPGADPLYPDGFFIDVKQTANFATAEVRDMVAVVVQAAKAEALESVGRDTEALRVNIDLFKRRAGR